MLVVRPAAIFENGIECSQILRVWVQPRVDALALDRHDTTIMSGLANFWRRLIGDRGERVEVRFALTLTSLCAGPEAGHQHVLLRLGAKLQHYVLFDFAGRKLAMLHPMPSYVFIEGIDDHYAVLVTAQQSVAAL